MSTPALLRRAFAPSRLALAALLLCPVAARAADPAQRRLESSPRHHEWIEVESRDGRIVKCFVAYPEVNKDATTVIIIHENKGLTNWERSVADRLAEAGYLAIAPDLLSGTGPGGGGTEAYPSRDAATKGIYSLPPERVMEDLDAVFKHAKEMDASNGKVVTAGFCWGGGKSFAYAAHNPELTAALVFYGSAPDNDALQNVKAPVFGFYGENDQRITGNVTQVAQAMQQAGKKFDYVVYNGAGHGFLRSGEQEDADEANRKAHEEAWRRITKILESL